LKYLLFDEDKGMEKKPPQVYGGERLIYEKISPVVRGVASL
jgi:hypothetical protein